MKRRTALKVMAAGMLCPSLSGEPEPQPCDCEAMPAPDSFEVSIGPPPDDLQCEFEQMIANIQKHYCRCGIPCWVPRRGNG
jgi:hypothetical protein